MWYCPKCGHCNNDSNLFCPRCGTPKRTNSAAPKSREDAPAPGKPAPKKVLLIAIIAAVLVIAAVAAALLFFNAKKESDSRGSEETYEDTYSSSKKKKKPAPVDYRSEAEDAMAAGQWEDALEAISQADYTGEEEAALVAECNYHLGVAAAESGSWETAAEYFSDNGYSDSAAKYEEAMRHINSDYDFLQDLAEAEKNFLRADKDSSFDAYRSALAAEVKALETYKGAAFYDARLGELAADFLDNMDERSTLCTNLYNNKIWTWYYQFSLWDLKVSAAETLSDLYREYGLLANDKDFIAAYIDGLTELKTQLSTICAFEESFRLNRSKTSASGWYNNSHQFIRYTNDTGIYLPSVTFYFTAYDQNDVPSEFDSVTMELPLKEKVKIVFKCTVGVSSSWDWDWYINF